MIYFINQQVLKLKDDLVLKQQQLAEAEQVQIEYTPSDVIMMDETNLSL